MGRGGSDDRGISTNPVYRGDTTEANAFGIWKSRRQVYCKWSYAARLSWEGTASKGPMAIFMAMVMVIWILKS